MLKLEKCPKCKNGVLQEMIFMGYSVFYVCDKCGYEEHDPNE